MSRKKAFTGNFRRKTLKRKQDELRKKHQARKEKIRASIKVEKRPKGAKPRILAIADVEGWTGWRKMHETKNHLSDQFDIDIITIPEMQVIYDDVFESDVEEHLLRVRGMGFHQKYDILYFYLHTSLQYNFIKDLTKLMKQTGGRTVAIVTQKVILKKPWGRTVAKRKSKFMEMSKHIQAFMINNLLVKPDLEELWKGPIYYVPEGIDLDLFKPLKYDITGEFVAAYAGKPAVEKGLKNIIVPACESAGVRLITNTNNYLTAVPYEKMVNFYNDANVYVVASLVDGGPNPALEAAACGRPIISNVIGNMPELIEDGVNGYIVKRSIDRYVEKLVELKENPEKAKKMGEMARKAMENEWSWQHVLNTYERPALWSILGDGERI